MAMTSEQAQALIGQPGAVVYSDCEIWGEIVDVKGRWAYVKGPDGKDEIQVERLSVDPT